MGKKKSYSSLKLFLYVSAAIIGAVVSDLQHYACMLHNITDITPLKLLSGALNAILQGLIAWRAFIDDSLSKDAEEENKNETFPH